MGGFRYISLAWRNLGRNRRRTIVTGSAIALGIGMFIVVMGLEDGSYRQVIQRGVSQIAGHVVIQAEGYQDNPEVTKTVLNSTEVARIASETAATRGRVVRRAFVEGLLSSPAGASGVQLVGIEPPLEAEVNELSEKLVEGQWVETDLDIVMGQLLSETLDVRLGDRVVLMAQRGGEIESWLFRVSGLFRSGIDEMDGFFALAHIEAIQEMLELGDGVHQISVHLENPRQTLDVASSLRSALAPRDLEVLPWQVALPEFYELMVFDQAGTLVFLAIIAFIVGLGILNTVLMSVLERTREFGVLLSLGLSPWRLGLLVLTESMLLALVAVTIGVVVGLLGSWPLAVYGLDVTALFGEAIETGGLPMDAHLYSHVYPSRVILFAGTGIIITLLATIYPVVKATRLEPVQAMHGH